MRTILAALLFFSAAAAAETSLVASIASYHFERGRGYCEVNPGVGLEHLVARELRLHVGQYDGSKCAQISYVGASWCALQLPHGVRGCIGALAFRGYEKDRDKLLLAPVPALRVPLGAHAGLNIPLFLPHEDFKGAIGLQLQLEVGFQ